MTTNFVYELRYEKGSRPSCYKKLVAASGEELSVEYSPKTPEEFSVFTSEQIYEHCENLLQYIKDTVPNLRVINLDESLPPDNWHIAGGWGEIHWAQEQIMHWWEATYYRDDPEGEDGGEPGV